MSHGKASIRKPLIGFSLFAVVALFMTYLIWSTLERSVSGSTSGFSTTFRDASGLAAGDDVRMAGVRVGRVNSIELDDGKALVTFEVQDSQRMYANTRAAIRYQNLIGQRYLALTIDGAKPARELSEGSRLQLPGEDSFDVTKLLAGFQPVFDTLSPEQVNSLSESLIQTFQGNTVSLTRTIAEIGQVAGDLANRDEVLGAIITNMGVVMRELASQGNQVQTLIDSAGKLVEGLNGNSAAFGKSLDQIGRTAEGFAAVFAENRSSLRSAGTAAREATNKLIASGAKIDRLAADLPVFLGHFPNVMMQGAYLNIYACDLDIAIGNVLFPPGLINKIGGTQHSVVCR
ncbi:MCE family protein [Gordonia sp. (in: high G+C Gram-positive bacteria)]|uniref:MCE family protein n=1 Tax=Gordonia sp. (in: high G+C Gram-positive bacteria) TaxID=84139 RepID=UPI0016A2C87E|nr:MCE family protein [Gordonia sp. (in: high G+C Gram-positive bacteria)]NLG46601.1 MCE family protein [Gordonia sp. (in: high G+C Gram-positive bacteria)]